MDQTNARPLDVVLRERVRALRGELGLSQDELARAAAWWGLGWRPATVAAIELGRRDLSIAELLLLPRVLTDAALRKGAQLRRALEVVDFVSDAGRIALTPETDAPASAIRSFVLNRGRKVRMDVLSTPGLRRARGGQQAALSAFHRRIANSEVERIAAKVWPAAPPWAMVGASVDAAGEAEQKAARKLALPAVAVALAARKLWKRGLAEERDRRVAEQAQGETPRRTLQALRGHVTRTLLTELQAELRSRGRHRAATIQ